MKQQVLVIHGGHRFSAEEEFQLYLQNKPITLNDLRPRHDWKAGLQARLGDSFDVLLPKMPNKENASYAQWSIWFNKIFPLLSENSIFVGHSLGGTFLVKYFSENAVNKKMKALICVAARFEDEGGRSLSGFKLLDSIDTLEKQFENIHFFHSTDDAVVPIVDLDKFEKALPIAKIHRFSKKGHFNAEDFPEIVELIQSL